MRKNYILDANILLHDPDSLFHFADNTVIIPIGVISEIDRFKKEVTDRGYNARAVARLLDGLRAQSSLSVGVRLSNGGMLRVHCESPPHGHGNGHVDAEILRVAQAVRSAEPDVPAIIVTKDINLRIRADASGLRAEDYESDHVALSDLYTGQIECVVPSDCIRAFHEESRLALNGRSAAPSLRGNGRAASYGDNAPALDARQSTHLADLSIPPSVGETLAPNQYVWLRCEDGSRATALARVDSDGAHLIPLRQPEKSLWGIKPRNKEQFFAIDALLDDQLSLVTLMGKAGTGKTLLAIAAAMHLALRARRFRGMLICRPTFPVGRDLGYLPGDIDQKLDPWMKPIVDSVEYLLDRGGSTKGAADVSSLVGSGLMEIQPLTYIRGRSISNRFVVIDEAQNLTPLEVKTVITRVGQDTKIVFTGDPYQIDNPYVDANSNGFTYLVNRFRAQPLAAHIELRKGERSALADLAANLL